MQGNHVFVRFGACSLDSHRRQLMRDDVVAHLTPKAFDLLVLLLTEAPRVVSKAELQERLWPRTYVSEANLTGLIKELRRVLDDHDRDHPIIRTVHRVGYAFCPEVRDISPRTDRAARHWLVLDDRRVALADGENVIGRDPASQVWLDAVGVSRRHARIVIDRTGARLEDLGSKNGTTVGKSRVSRGVVLHDGDRISFSAIVGVYRTSSAGMSTETRSRTTVRSKSPAIGG